MASRIILFFSYLILLTGCDTLATVSLSDQGYKTINNQCGENRIILVNGIAPDSYQLSIGTSYDAKINLKNLFIVFDADTVNEFSIFEGYNSVASTLKNNNELQYWYSLDFQAKYLQDTEKLIINLDSVIECGVNSQMNEIILSPPKLWSHK